MEQNGVIIPNIYYKERSEKQVIEISKNEMKYLASHGCRWHGDIMAPLSRAHYYARDCEKVNNLLNKYRNQYIKKVN